MADGHSGLKVYIAASFRHLHAARLLGRAIRAMGYGLLDWTELAKPPEGLTPAERRAWMDTDHGGEVFAFCERACREADFVVYLGASGQDAGVEVGLARAWGVPVLGIRGPLEAPVGGKRGSRSEPAGADDGVGREAERRAAGGVRSGCARTCAALIGEMGERTWRVKNG